MRLPAKSGRMRNVVQAAGVVASMWLLWSDTLLPHLHWDVAAGFAVQALFWVTFAWICATAIAIAVYFVISLADTPEVMRFSLRSAAPAMWFAPAIILASNAVPALVLVSLILVATAASQLISNWAPPAVLESAALQPLIAICAASAAELGLVAELWHRPMIAAALIAAGAAVITALALAAGAWQPAGRSTLPHPAFGMVMAFLLAVSLCFGGLRIGKVSRSSSDQGTPDAAQSTNRAESRAGNPAMDGDFPGVILLPEIKRQAVLLLPPALAPSALTAPLTKPAGIPFSGEYWMFRWPNRPVWAAC